MPNRKRKNKISSKFGILRRAVSQSASKAYEF